MQSLASILENHPAQTTMRKNKRRKQHLVNNSAPVPASMQSPMQQYSCPPVPIFGYPCRVRLMHIDSSKDMNVVTKAASSSSELRNKMVRKQHESSYGGSITY